MMAYPQQTLDFANSCDPQNAYANARNGSHDQPLHLRALDQDIRALVPRLGATETARKLGLPVSFVASWYAGARAEHVPLGGEPPAPWG